jgi:hypothetical protein
VFPAVLREINFFKEAFILKARQVASGKSPLPCKAFAIQMFTIYPSGRDGRTAEQIKKPVSGPSARYGHQPLKPVNRD